MIINNKKVTEIVNKHAKKQKKLLHAVLAFLIGGSFGMIGEGLYVIYYQLVKIAKNEALMLVSLTLIFLAIILTAVGTFDNLAKHGGAGSFIPIVGFANAMSSSAIEGKSEGLIFGIGGKIFSLVGSVFAYGILTSCVCGILYYIWWVIK